MLTANEHDPGEHLPPELAQPLEAVCSDPAVNLTAQCVQFDDLNARSAAMQHVVTRTICNSPRDWNLSHDHLRVLPVELRALCWSHLPQSDIVGLACICSSWRDLSRGIPSLWTTLDVTGPIPDLDVLFSRSGRLHLDISMTVYGLEELARVDHCVGKHADHLRDLCISVRDVAPTGNGWARARDLFRYPAPVLQHFSFKLLGQINYRNLRLPSNVFNSHAPKLRSLTLHEIPFRAGCSAFSRLARLNFQWCLPMSESGLNHVFTDSPGLEHLALLNIRDWLDLPPVPITSKLHKMTWTAETAHCSRLRDCGYFDLPRLEVNLRDPGALIDAGKYPDPSRSATLSIGATGAGVSVLTLRNERGAVATFTEDHGSQIPYVILQNMSEFQTLQRLVLPIAAPYSTKAVLGAAERTRYPYLPKSLRLAALRTLTLVHGAYRMASLLDPAVLCGLIRAPRLSRLEIVRATDSDVPDAVNPGLLALFIDKHIECDGPDALEASIEAGNTDLLDVADKEGMAQLRRCVGKIVYGHHEIGRKPAAPGMRLSGICNLICLRSANARCSSVRIDLMSDVRL